MLDEVQKRAILARNPNKKVRKALNDLGRAGDLNAFQGGYGSHRTSKRDGERRRRRKEDRELTRLYS